jgi:cyanophycinase
MSAVLLALLLAADPAAAPKGKLVPVGGGSTEPLRKRILELAGGSEARVLVIPFASSRADGKDSAKMWLDLGAKSAEPLARGDTETAIKAVEAANFIWMSGGDQVLLMKALPKEVVAAIKTRYYNGAVVGGTSAGAAVISAVMITGDGYNLDAIRHEETKTADGLGLWPEVIVDQHFVKRHRFNRLLSAVMDRPTLVGVGIDESTGVVVSGNTFEVIGVGQVVVVDGRKSSVAPLQPNVPFAATGLQLHVLAPGMKWEWK